MHLQFVGIAKFVHHKILALSLHVYYNETFIIYDKGCRNRPVWLVRTNILLKSVSLIILHFYTPSKVF